MKTYAIGNYGVEVSKTWKGWEWQVHKDGRQLQSGTAASAPDGMQRAQAWVDAQAPPPEPVPQPATSISSVAPTTVNVSEGVAVEDDADAGDDEAADETAASAPSDRTKIKADFPHAEQLIAAGLTTYGRVRKASDEDLLAIEHIGPAAAAKIREAQ